MKFAFPPMPIPSVSIAGTDERFPIRRIFCCGRNYAEHAREFGRDPNVSPPFFFTKPADAIVEDGESVAYPSLTENFHFEGELVVALGKSGADLGEDEVLDCVYGYAVGNDLTRRDIQMAAIKVGMPWDWGKAFDRSAVCGPIHKVEDVGHVLNARLKLFVNGEVRQDTDVADMVWSVPKILSLLSQAVRFEPGDLVYTGTPAGVGALVPGDVCVVSIEGLGEISTTITEREVRRDVAA